MRAPEPRKMRPFAIIMQEPWALAAAGDPGPALMPGFASASQQPSELGALSPILGGAKWLWGWGAFLKSHQASQPHGRRSQSTCLVQDTHMTCTGPIPKTIVLGWRGPIPTLKRWQGRTIRMPPRVGKSPPGVRAARGKGVELPDLVRRSQIPLGQTAPWPRSPPAGDRSGL